MLTSPVRAAIRQTVTDRLMNDAQLSARIDSETDVEFERVAERGFRIPSLFSSVREDIARGLSPIMVIKNVREATGWGLKDAKDFVDAFRLPVKFGA